LTSTLTSQILFFFSALGTFNGIMLCLYFMMLKKEKTVADIVLGALLLALSVRVGKSVVFYFNNQLPKIYLQIGLSACFFIGPLLYFFVRATLRSINLAVAKYSLAALLLLTIIFGVLFPYQDYPWLWGNLVYRIINFQWLIFILLSAFVTKSVFRKLFTSRNLITNDDVWVITILCGVSAIWLSYFLSKYTSYISGALTFSFGFYVSFLLLFFMRDKLSISITTNNKYINKIDEKLASEIHEKIITLFEVKKIYTTPNLTLPTLAEDLNIRPQLLSQFLNDNVKKSFTQFINEYRVEEAKRLLKENTDLKIDAVGMECGFNSSSTFYSAFKKMTGTTPAAFQKS
jgi:AraC-like DNA-binding protein